jgi:hypothetical protein
MKPRGLPRLSRLSRVLCGSTFGACPRTDGTGVSVLFNLLSIIVGAELAAA